MLCKGVCWEFAFEALEQNFFKFKVRQIINGYEVGGHIWLTFLNSALGAVVQKNEDLATHIERVKGDLEK